MSKYKKYLKKVNGRVAHQCFACGSIMVNEYYRETNEDQFLQTLNAKSFCVECYDKYGDKLLDKAFIKKIQKDSPQSSETKRLDQFSEKNTGVG
ncbi:MAG TPA: hypothetical protein VLH35_05760 [Candidatus Acidoferrales bacterium]|nr:hypothetical protein [Candidatus Acidoferrales bacterium]